MNGPSVANKVIHRTNRCCCRFSERPTLRLVSGFPCLQEKSVEYTMNDMLPVCIIIFVWGNGPLIEAQFALTALLKSASRQAIRLLRRAAY